MNNDTRSPAEIEKDIETNRERLTDTLNEVQDRFSVERLARQVTDQFSEHGGDIGRSVSESLKKNPLAIAVTGIGLAWLIFGNGRGQPDLTQSGSREQDRSGQATIHDRPRGIRSSDRSHSPQRSYPSRSSRPHDPDLPVWATRGGKVGASAGDMGNMATNQTHNQDTSLGEDTRDANETASDRVKAGGQAVSDRMVDLRDRLSHGTEDMSAAARDRIVAARQKATNAYDQVYDAAQQGRSQLADFYDRQPLVIGALGLAIGAAIGAIAPRTDAEDDAMGAQRDHLFAEAERIYDEEKAKLEAVAEEAVKDVKSQTGKASQAISESIKSSVDTEKSDAGKVAAKTPDVASQQDLGETST